jgi:hypothetical protein
VHDTNVFEWGIGGISIISPGHEQVSPVLRLPSPGNPGGKEVWKPDGMTEHDVVLVQDGVDVFCTTAGAAPTDAAAPINEERSSTVKTRKIVPVCLGVLCGTMRTTT